MSDLLTVEEMSAGYDGNTVVRNIGLSVEAGELVTLAGPNGAGKTTILSCISGLTPVTSGSVQLSGRSLVGLAPHRIAAAGVAHVPEGRSLFRSLSVRENLVVPGRRGSARRSLDTAIGLFPELEPLLDRRAGLLSGGEQQMLAISRAMVVSPKVLIVDEMSLGLAPIVVQRLIRVLRDAADTGDVGVLVVEQHIPLILPKADRAYILVHGELVFDGPASRLQDDPAIVAATYLGDGAAEPGGGGPSGASSQNCE